MTIDERVSRLEARVDNLEKIEQRLGRIEETLVGMRSDFNTFRSEHAAIHERIIATLQELQRRPVVFRWPWEGRHAENT